MNRAEAIEDIVNRMQTQGISLQEIAQALSTPTATIESKKSDLVATVFSYLGGTFIFAGITAFIAMQWDNMNSASRIIITLGPGIITFVWGVWSLKDSRWAKLTNPLLLMAAWLQPTGLFVLIYELFRSGNDARLACLLVFGVMAVQQLAAFCQFRRTLLVFTSMVFGYSALYMLLDLADVGDNISAIIIGVSLVCIARALQTSLHAALSGVSYFIGSAFLLSGAYDLITRSPLELLYIAIPCAMIYFSTQFKSRALLFTSTISMLAFIADFTARYFADVVGWPIALIVFGFLLFGISAAAWRIKNRYL
jgi:hypothetical protein